jgi:hypothetical protein
MYWRYKCEFVRDGKTDNIKQVYFIEKKIFNLSKEKIGYLSRDNDVLSIVDSINKTKHQDKGKIR